MAWNFGAQINSLTGFDANLDSSSEEGEDYTTLANQWLTDAAKEVINILPRILKEKCTTETTLNHSATTIDLDTLGGEVLYVNRLSADSGGSRIPCRKVPSMYGELSNDANSIYKASVTDPVYWILSSSDAAILNVIPTPTENQTAIVYHIGYPTVDHSHNAIANFPDEAEHLVVLKAAIIAAEYKLNFEEDVELYAPMINNLKQEYQQGVLGLQTGKLYATKKDNNDS
tara:strand:- start:2558 stop:3244 length:687 start_codon:yes stop_codon:yes gene_type:complete